jgi:hypothetical protein
VNPRIGILLGCLEVAGSQGMVVTGKVGPRRPGHCVYCAGPCQGVTTQCEVRVWEESLRLRKDA